MPAVQYLPQALSPIARYHLPAPPDRHPRSETVLGFQLIQIQCPLTADQSEERGLPCSVATNNAGFVACGDGRGCVIEQRLSVDRKEMFCSFNMAEEVTWFGIFVNHGCTAGGNIVADVCRP